jgi:phosphoglycerate kinase
MSASGCRLARWRRPAPEPTAASVARRDPKEELKRRRKTMQKQTVRDFDPQGKRVLMRVDFNVPIEDGKVKDDSRIRAALPTIHYLLDHGASVILMSHLGRPKGKVVESARLRPVAQRLSTLLRLPVPITGDALGVGTRDAVARLKPGQVLMLENLRFHAQEETNDPDYARTLASYGDVFVNDAFGTAHRAHASRKSSIRLPRSSAAPRCRANWVFSTT